MTTKPDLNQDRVPCGNCDENNKLNGLNDLCLFYNIDKTYRILELGVYEGVSTSLFAYYAGEVIGVDSVKQDKLNTVLDSYKNITFKQGSISDILRSLPDNYYDLIYIDADHFYESVIHDIKVSIPKLKTGGILAGHDYAFPNVSRAVCEIFPKENIKTFLDTSWSIQL